MPSLSWYAGRVGTMSPREMLWRVGRLTAAVTDRERRFGCADARVRSEAGADWGTLSRRFGDGTGRPVLLDQVRAHRIAAVCPAAAREVRAEADRVVAGQRSYFGYPTVNVGHAVDWNYDPVADFRWPSMTGGRIDHQRTAGDPKWIWELNRLQHLPVLAQAWLFTGESRYAETALGHIDSWLAQNPIGATTMWRNAFEVGIRAISVAVAMQGLRNSPAMTVQRFRRVSAMLDAGARYCWSGRSRFSSANNHLVGELTGLVTVHLLYPELAAPAALYRRAVDTLCCAARRLILPDGAGAEQSVSYQVFTAELLTFATALWRLNGERVPTEIGAALDRSARYLAAVVGSDDPDPRYGDDDDGFAIRLGAEPKRTVREHLGIVAAATGNRCAAACGETTITATWIADALGADVHGVGARSGGPSASMYAPDGGLVVLRSKRHRVTVDVGPLGYLSTAAHGHADALAVTLSDRGRDLIVDPGTGSYCGNPAWRAVHRGTRAHPTVCVDDLDQSVIGGPFYWRRHAVTTVRAVDLDRGIVEAQHDGYHRLADPVTHRRWVVAAPGEATVVVVDLLDGAEVHDIALSWPLHPDLDRIPTQSGHLVSRDGRPVLQLCYAATSPIAVDALRADPESGLGWWSGRLEDREPAWLLTVHTRVTLPVALLTVLGTAAAGTLSQSEITCSGSQLRARWAEDGAGCGVVIDIDEPGTVTPVPRSARVRLVSNHEF